MATKVKDGVHLVGVVDWSLRSFHGHELSTRRGSSYNAYLIRDEKNVLVDTVWDPYAEQFMRNLRELIDPAELDYVVANHAETDHSGSLPALMKAAPNAKLVVSERGRESIEGHYHQPWDFYTVGTGDTIDIGGDELLFVEAPMLHWPDSMFTYLKKRHVLMPNDAFGQHYATAFPFNDQVNQKELYEEALKYYVNILNPFSTQVERKIGELLEMDLPLEVIAPSHGVIWREEPEQIVEKYLEWAAQEPRPCAVILYDTMWHATERMAKAIGEGLAGEGVDYKLLHMAVTDRNDALVEVHKAHTVLVGSPTINNGVLPTLTPILADLKGLKFKNKIGAAFGSYGWSGQGVALIEEHFQQSGIPVAREGIRCKWQPDGEDLEACRRFGRELAEPTRDI